MSDQANVLVVGGGVIGTSLAWSLAARGVSDIVVVDLDLAGIYASSELNAGGARATWWQPVNIESCRVTLGFFADHSEQFGFRSVGYLWLYGDEGQFARALEARVSQVELGLEVEGHGGALYVRPPHARWFHAKGAKGKGHYPLGLRLKLPASGGPPV